MWKWCWEKVSFSRSRKYKPTKLSWLQNKTSRQILVSFGAISLKQCPSFSPFNFIKQKTWFEMFSRFTRNQTYRIFLFLHIPLAIHHNFRNWHQIFYNRSSSYKIHIYQVLYFLVYHFHGNINYLKKHIQPNFNLFPKTGFIFASISY